MATIAYVVLTFLDEERIVAVPEFYLIFFPAIFVGEFVVRFLDTTDRRQYLRSHWIDAVTAIPLLGVLRALRLLRLLRLLGVMRLITTVDKMTVHGHQERSSLSFLGPVLVAVWVGAGYTFWILEHGVNPNVRTFGDALYMAFGAATTFGYSNAQPVTAQGHILASLLIFVGIGLVTFASSQVTAAFLHQKDPMNGLHEDLAAIKLELHEVRSLLSKAEDDLNRIDDQSIQRSAL